MTQPLKYDSGFNLKQMTTGEFALFRYNLRTKYAASLVPGGTGAIIVGGGTNFGTATNTERTPGQRDDAHSFQDASTGVLAPPRQVFTYGQNLAGVPSNPTDFAGSYVQFTNDTFIQERDINRIVDFVINPCIEEMRNGDEVGTYRVSIASPPGDGWSNRGVFFRDSKYANSNGVTYFLWLRLTASASNVGVLPRPLKVVPLGLQEQVTTVGSPFEKLVYPLLVNRLNSGSLRYDIGTGLNRGNFLDTRFNSLTRSQQFIHADDYRTFATPSGGSATFTTYFLGLN